MANPELLIISILRALTEVALLTLLGQGLLACWLAADARRTRSIGYSITEPVIRAVRSLHRDW